MSWFCRAEALLKSTDLDRTFLDAMHEFCYDMLPKDTNVIVENMVDLGAEFPKTTCLFSPLFAQYVSKYDEFAEGIQFISLQFLMKRIVIDHY